MCMCGAGVGVDAMNGCAGNGRGRGWLLVTAEGAHGEA